MRSKYVRSSMMVAMVVAIFGFAACGSFATGNVGPGVNEEVSITPTAGPTVEAQGTSTPMPTAAPTPTPTTAPEPTITPVPTATSAPTATGTPTVTPTPTTSAELVSWLEEAERMAAGYDYLGAIELLRTYEGYEASEEIQQKILEYTELDGKLVSLTRTQLNNVPHIFFHSLIVDTSRAFDGDGDSNGYNLYMTTIDEFNKMMQQMYERGYVLISPYDIVHEVTDENGTRMVYGDIRLPEGKKPFILSQDDVNYYSYMIGNGNGKGNVPATIDKYGDGFATKILVDENGELTCEYVDMDGNISYGAYDMVPLIEQFVKEHPDFSYHGAKGILGLTGYEGVLGYRTKPSYAETIGEEAWQEEVAQAKLVVECLKEKGWLIASHTYGHPDYGAITFERVKTDNQKWVDTVASIVGETDLLIYPYGSDVNDWHRYTFENAKYSYLHEAGYRYFFNVDGTAGWTQISDHSFRGGRVNADGHRMWVRPDSLEQFFDVKSVLDPTRPTLAGE